MNINVSLPEGSIQRLIDLAERIATSLERIAGPQVVVQIPEPYPADLWGTSSNAESRQNEEEERAERAGFGVEYRRAIESQVPRRPTNSPSVKS